MGKVAKTKDKKANRNNPLDQQITKEKYAKASSRVKVRNHKEDDEHVDDKLTQKILTQARQQLEDLEEENGLGSICKRLQTSHLYAGLPQEKDEEEYVDTDFTGEEFQEEIEISEEDKKAFDKLMPEDPDAKSALAETLKEKLTEKQTEIHTMFSDAGTLKPEQQEEVVAYYKRVGQVLCRYRSGKLPIAFKFIPKLPDWEQILYITEPDNWTAAAMYQATRIFASNLNADMAQRFYNLILLPRLRDDIGQCKKLNIHLYQALKKALFKPAAFFRGIILPLCESDCTMREATIFGSVLAKCSVPILHSSTALLLIARMGFSSANCILMRVLIEKKYALPYLVIDGVVDYFLRFFKDEQALPLLWHQCLLTFVETYKNDFSAEQQRELLRLLTVHSHQHVTPEIRRELMSGTCTRSAEKSESVAKS